MQRILLVEDNEDILNINRKMLEMEGYDIDTAKSLREARDVLFREVPDLIVLDIMLPDGSGLDLCQEVGEELQVPVLFLSALGEKDQVIEGLRLGGDDYIIKPYNLDELSARIAAILRRSGPAKSERVSIGPLTLDYISRIAYIDGVDVMLKSKEFGLLALLIQKKGQYLMPEELYAGVWGQFDNNDLRTVRVHISHLRQKLRISEDTPFQIVYTYKKGYCFLERV